MTLRKLRAKSPINPDEGIGTPCCPETNLVVECRQPPEHEAVCSVIREWLVPPLVKEFRAEEQAAARALNLGLERKRIIERVSGKEAQ